MNSLTLVFIHLLLATAFRLNNATECPGCSSPVENPNSEEIRNIMSSTLSQTNAGYTITNVKNCKKQVVAGIKFDCEVDIKSPSGVPATCRLVVVHKPWDVNEKVQVVEETCSSVSRTKREVCAGCPVEEDANGSVMKKKLNGILSQTNSGLSLVRGNDCTKQVVAGIKYSCNIEVESPQTNGVQKCKLEFVEQPWISPKTTIIKDTCSEIVRNKREVCAGCPVEQDANSSEMKKKLQGLLSQTNSGLSLVRGTKCTSQVVAGIRYECIMEVESPKTNGVQTCKMTFVEQPWLSHAPQVIKDTCAQLVRNKREVCAGCPVEQNPNDPEIKKKITNTLSQTNSGLGLVNVEKCTSQVVAGALYKCTIRVNSSRFNGVATCELELLEQPWISKELKVVKDTCSQLGRAKREVLGGLKDVDANEKVLVQELATYAVSTLDDIDADDNKRLVAEVIRAQKQLVNGIMYYLKLRVRTTSCDENKEINDECVAEDAAPQKLCDIQVYRSFADKSPLNAKVVKSECEPVTDLMKLGGYEPVQTNGDEVQTAAKFAAKRISEMINSNTVHRLMTIESAATKVVSGVNYKMTIILGATDCNKNKVNEDSVCKFLPHTETHLMCEVEVYEKPWEKIMKLTSNNCVNLPNVSVERAKRALLGGYTPVETNDDNVQKAADFAERRINQKVNSIFIKKIVAIEQAKQQVVAGMNYDLTLRLQDTTCKKNRPHNNKNCEFLANAKMEMVCNVEVYDDLSDVMHLSKINCEDVPISQTSAARNKRALLGGYTPVKTNDDSVQKVADFAQKRINDMVNSIYVKKVASIERAETQVVSGTNYALTLRLEDTDCMKNRPYVNSDCHTLSDARTDLLCSVVIYENLNNELSMTDSNCKDVPRIPNTNPRNKRATVGGVSNVDVHSSEVTSLFPLISREVTQRTNSPNLMRVTKTISASKQVVAGLKYTLKVEVSSTECPASVNADPQTCTISESPMKQICDITIWSKPWMKYTEITSFNCEENEENTAEKYNDDKFDNEEEFEIKKNGETAGRGNNENSFANDEIVRLSAILETSLDDVDFHQFATFLASYEKVYPNENEYKKRFRVFRANMRKVKYLQDTEQGTGQYGATEFADLTKSEFKKYFLGFKMEEGRWPQRPQAEIPNVTLPLEYDWRDYGAVTKVKNQGMCGSCWAFSITGNVEGQYAIKNKKLLSLSEQELVDCDKYDSGCNGGFFDSAFHALEDLGGLETETDYPYEGIDDKCRFNTSKVKVSISSSVNISSDETNMAKWLYKNGPISVALNANAMQFYMGGVSHPLKFLCSPNNLDHGVLVVGFGVHKTTFLKKHLPYWIVKNSWGPGWGKKGYYWLYRGDGSCGINKMPTSAIL